MGARAEEDIPYCKRCLLDVLRSGMLDVPQAPDRHPVVFSPKRGGVRSERGGGEEG